MSHTTCGRTKHHRQKTLPPAQESHAASEPAIAVRNVIQNHFSAVPLAAGVDLLHTSLLPSATAPEVVGRPQNLTCPFRAAVRVRARDRHRLPRSGGVVKDISSRRTVQRGIRRARGIECAHRCSNTHATCTKGGLQIATPDGGGRQFRLIRSIDRTGRWCLQHLTALWVIFTHDTELSAHVQSLSVKDACVRGCQRRDAHANKPRLSSAPARGVVTPSSVRKVP